MLATLVLPIPANARDTSAPWPAAPGSSCTMPCRQTGRTMTDWRDLCVDAFLDTTHISYWTLDTLHWTVYTCLLDNVHCLYYVQCTRSVLCTMYTICTMYNVHCLYYVQCTLSVLCSVNCTVCLMVQCQFHFARGNLREGAARLTTGAK